MGAFASKTRFLDPAKGGLRGADETLVDPDHPDLQPLAHTPALAHVIGVEVARKADPAVVGQGDSFLETKDKGL